MERKPRRTSASVTLQLLLTRVYIRGAALAKAGPASLFLAYCTIGLNVYVTMTAVGEIATYLPTGVGFSGYAARFVDPALGFSLGQSVLFQEYPADRH